MQDGPCQRDDPVHGQIQPDDAGKPGALKGARRVWRGAFGTGQLCTSLSAYPTSLEHSKRNAWGAPSISPMKRHAWLSYQEQLTVH
jgi:hypothetical protein